MTQTGIVGGPVQGRQAHEAGRYNNNNGHLIDSTVRINMGSSHSTSNSQLCNDDEMSSSYYDESSAFDSDNMYSDDDDDGSSLTSVDTTGRDHDEQLQEEDDTTDAVIVEKEHIDDPAAVVMIHSILQDLKWDASTVERVITRDAVLRNSKSHVVQEMLSQEFDLERHTQVAVEILGASQSTRHLRFKLVPGRMKEHVFWATVFYLLKQEEPSVQEGSNEVLCNESDVKEEVPEEESENNITNGTSNNDHGEVPHATANGMSNGTASNYDDEEINEGQTTPSQTTPHHSLLSSTYGHSFQQVMNGHADSHATDHLKNQLKEKTWKILELEKRLEEANKRIVELTSGAMEKNTMAVSNNTIDPCHKGKWVLSQDSQDFLALDDELKQNLRSEKQKRLNDVRQQMKFILDSDDVHDSVGEWDCCHATTYSAQGCNSDGEQQQPRKVPEAHRSASAVV